MQLTRLSSAYHSKRAFSAQTRATTWAAISALGTRVFSNKILGKHVPCSIFAFVYRQPAEKAVKSDGEDGRE